MLLTVSTRLRPRVNMEQSCDVPKGVPLVKAVVFMLKPSTLFITVTHESDFCTSGIKSHLHY